MSTSPGLRGVPWRRHQLPAYSPLSLSAIIRGARTGLRDQTTPGELAELLRSAYAADGVVLCGSGTDALQRAISVAARGQQRPIVALPAFSCYDVATAAVGANARIALYDIEPRTLQPDLESLRQAVSAGAGIVVVAPLYGVPVDWNAIESAASGAQVIEDAAQGHGASWRGAPLGALGSVSVLSFGRGKGWTGGGGGALLTRGVGSATDGALATGGNSRVLAAALTQWLFGRAELYGMLASIPWLALGETVYHAPSPLRDMPALAAALALETLGDAQRCAEERRNAAAAYRARLADAPGVSLIDVDPGAEAGYLRFPIRVAGGVAALGERAQLRRLGVMPGYPTPLDALPAVRARFVRGAVVCAGATELARSLVTLPTHGRVSASEREAIIARCGATTPSRGRRSKPAVAKAPAAVATRNVNEGNRESRGAADAAAVGALLATHR
jgi:dTDP-4-amino-4,6-dideoxygalactose transaminase